MKLFQLLPKKLYDFACNLPRHRGAQRKTKEHREGLPVLEPQISQILSRLRACYRTQDCQNIFTTKSTKVHKEHKGL